MTRAEWLAGLKPGDEVAVVEIPAGFWCVLATVAEVWDSRILLEGGGWFARTTGQARLGGRTQIVPPDDGLRAKAAHHKAASALIGFDFAALPPATLRQIVALIAEVQG